MEELEKKDPAEEQEQKEQPKDEMTANEQALLNLLEEQKTINKGLEDKIKDLEVKYKEIVFKTDIKEQSDAELFGIFGKYCKR